MHEEPASIGKSIVINGELSGSEDLTIEGRVDGTAAVPEVEARTPRPAVAPANGEFVRV